MTACMNSTYVFHSDGAMDAPFKAMVRLSFWCPRSYEYSESKLPNAVFRWTGIPLTVVRAVSTITSSVDVTISSSNRKDLAGAAIAP